ncbi:hypothetical protein Cgig2_017696 [Carnegiea gigantea]|uniref:Terpene synthase metal-binding domain-containing protein n=1 Tax=Carnegiea gigantea TaxID=171969 RepID=A0A9Q1GPD2_9CARY|nr:hypothetical protein Cgig2_017696 [Carnegiea gigantea]
MDQLSKNMKIVYEFVINLYDDFAKEMTKKGKPDVAEYVMDSIQHYMEEVKRCEVEYTLTYEEYMVEGRLIGNGPILLISSLMGVDEIFSIMPYQLEEQARGEAPSAMECYMKEYSVTRREAIGRFEKMIEDAWQDINEAALTTCKTKNTNGYNEEDVPKPVFERVLNLCLLVNVLYKYSDSFTYPAKVIKDHVTALYADLFFI